MLVSVESVADADAPRGLWAGAHRSGKLRVKSCTRRFRGTVADAALPEDDDQGVPCPRHESAPDQVQKSAPVYPPSPRSIAAITVLEFTGCRRRYLQGRRERRHGKRNCVSRRTNLAASGGTFGQQNTTTTKDNNRVLQALWRQRDRALP